MDVIEAIRTALPRLRPAEVKVARLVLADPDAVLESTVASLARRAGVSQATVIRLTRALGLSGLPALRIELAQELSRQAVEFERSNIAQGKINPSDSTADVVAKVAFHEARSIEQTARGIDLEALEQVARAIAEGHHVVTFGVGAGWTRREHEAYSWELYDPKTRVDRFEEALEIWDLLQAKERVTYLGKHYELIDAPFEPKSSQGKLPVLIGGTKPRMMRLVAKYADIWNSVGDLDEAGTASKNLDKACLEIGRDPATIVRSVSPARVFLESPAKFEEHFHAYRALGFTDFRLPWPRNPGQKEVFDEVVVDLLPKLRQAS